MRRSTVFLLAAAVALTTAITMSPAQAASFSVSASISTSSAQSGDGPFIKGKISPARARVINLQRYVSGGWQTIETTTSKSDGTYGKRLGPDDLNYDIGSLKFRAVVASPDSGKSSTVTKTVYGWRSLAYTIASAGDSYRYFDDGPHLTVNGDGAEDGWLSAIDGGGYTKWNLQEKCIRLRGFAGLDDETSGTASLAKLSIGLDGTSHDYVRTFEQFEYATLDKPLYKTKYLTFKSTRIELDENAPLGVGEPRILCSKELPSD